ncbi:MULTISPECIES: hypothetical protein [unclassified Nitratiruptor]|uniref:hypothetical protein n=1 Tax=unclassified Nitratiruptor TaxID=2624044 RepID=UPI0019159A55|nr:MULTISPECIES: hypothetical protein [unclassified Nitratiruptor]BCD63866.1 hypothetical protein NitYY0814_C0701 [Nitratiruptor sp. YY08-14]
MSCQKSIDFLRSLLNNFRSEEIDCYIAFLNDLPNSLKECEETELYQIIELIKELEEQAVTLQQDIAQKLQSQESEKKILEVYKKY